MIRGIKLGQTATEKSPLDWFRQYLYKITGIEGSILSILTVVIILTSLAKGYEEGIGGVWAVHILVFVGLALWMVVILKEKRVNFIRTDLDYPILIFIILSIISATFSVAPKKSFVELLKYFDYAILYYLIVNKVRGREQIKWLLYVIIAVGSMLSFCGLIKYLGNSGRIQRILTFSCLNPNTFAAYLEMVIPPAMVMMAFSMGSGKKLLISYCICIMMVAFILTLSRGGWFSLLLALVVMGYLHLRKGNNLQRKVSLSILLPILLIVGIVLIITVILGFVNVRSELTKSKANIESLTGRVPIWKGTIDIIRDYPLLGSGPGTFPLMYESYVKKYKKNLRILYAHNEYLQAISELGVFSIFIIFWMQALFFRQAFRIYTHKHSGSFSKYLGLGVMGSMTAISIHSLVDFNLHFMGNAVLCVVFAGIIMGHRGRTLIKKASTPNISLMTNTGS